MRVFIGYDHRELAAFDVAAKTARSFGCEVIPLYEGRLRLSGMLTRPVDRRNLWYDLNSDASQATDFAIARFGVPLLAHSGIVLFADCDVVFLEDPHQLLGLIDESKAVSVVKHEIPKSLPTIKMDGQVQSWYPRKLWSSITVWNCDHPANARLNLTVLNQWPGRDLHAFRWLGDDDIGELSPEWNWLCGLQPKPDNPKIAHFTLGTPNMPGHEDDPHAEIWLEASRR